MSCGGYLLRNPFRPLALLVDDLAERWEATEPDVSARALLYEEISARFTTGDRPEVTFHGTRYQLCLRRAPERRTGAAKIRIEVHRIAGAD